MNILTCLIALLLLQITITQTPDDDEVSTPIPDYNHKIYSGYLSLSFITVPKRIHYILFNSQNSPNKDPLVVWLSGGPGCSGLLSAFQENGPFIIPQGKHTLKLNQHAWNKNANMLYLQVPGGVGFSQGPVDFQNPITDDIFTFDVIETLRAFFARFPTYKKNDLYLSGHGYGGAQVAYLARRILQENNDPYVIYNDDFNLKGILIGNPCVKPEECYASGSEKHSFYHYEFLYHRGYFPKSTWQDFRSNCLLDYDGFECYQKRLIIDKAFNQTNSSMYNIYDKCYKGQSDDLNFVNTGCEDQAGLINYLNDKIVQQNWNIGENKTWEPCNKEVFKDYMANGAGTYWMYPYLIQNKIRIWVYTGDLDSYVPIIGTKKWISDLRYELNMPIKRIWREWWAKGKHSGEDQVGGFIWQLRDLTLVTVKGAGHRAGIDQPQAFSEIIENFLNGKTLPYKNE